MKFIFQKKAYEFPTSLSSITLRQRIDFNTQYGRDLFEERVKLLEIEEESEEKDSKLTELYLMTACKTFSFFSGIPLEDVVKIPINQVMNVYENCMKGLLDQQEDIELQNEFVWNDEIWILGAPELTYQSNLSFNQFLTSKQIAKALHDMGLGMWETLPKLCAIFLKKDGEEFDEAWIADGNERHELMLDLPLDIALQVGFFLKSSMISFSQTFQSSPEEEMEKDQI